MNIGTICFLLDRQEPAGRAGVQTAHARQDREGLVSLTQRALIERAQQHAKVWNIAKVPREFGATHPLLMDAPHPSKGSRMRQLVVATLAKAERAKLILLRIRPRLFGYADEEVDRSVPVE